MQKDLIQCLSKDEFRRLTGVKRATFEKMLELLAEAHQQKNREGVDRTRWILKRCC